MKCEYNKITLLAGNSGSGKSTILSLLSGIIPNSIAGDIKGDILIDDESILNKSIKEISKKVSTVLQNADSQIIMPTVEEEMAFGLENIALNRMDMEHAIKKYSSLFNLDTKKESKYLSGGEKQRLITSSILAMGNKILILDEPLANIDKENAIFLINLIYAQ